MSEDDSLRPEAVTAARWWGDYLRTVPAAMNERVLALKALSDSDESQSQLKRQRYNFLVKTLESLTEENIAAFERYLAEAITEMMADDPQTIFVKVDGQWDLGEPLTTACRRAGIQEFLAIGLPTFSIWIATAVKPGSVLAFPEDNSVRPLEIRS